MGSKRSRTTEIRWWYVYVCTHWDTYIFWEDTWLQTVKQVCNPKSLRCCLRSLSTPKSMHLSFWVVTLPHLNFYALWRQLVFLPKCITFKKKKKIPCLETPCLKSSLVDPCLSPNNCICLFEHTYWMDRCVVVSPTTLHKRRTNTYLFSSLEEFWTKANKHNPTTCIIYYIVIYIFIYII